MTMPVPGWGVDDIIEVTSVNYMTNQLGLMIHHYQLDNMSGAGCTLEEVAAAMEAKFALAQRDLMCVVATHRGYRIRRISPVKTAYFIDIADQGVGAVPGEPLPSQVSGIITLQTALPGRTNRGRKYMPFPSEGDNGVDHIPSLVYMPLLGALATLFTQFVTCGVLGSICEFRPIIYRGPAFVIHSTVVNARANRKWATQRRRGSYGAANAMPF